MARAIWKGIIQFGPVRVPVKLYTAVEDTRAHSHLLHDDDLERLEQRMVCPEEDQTVNREEIVKGFALDEQRYVLVEPDELESLNPEPSRRIDTFEFVEIENLDPRYMDRTYYLGPDEKEQDYVNLADSLRQSNLASVCRWVMRKKPYMGLLQCARSTMSLTTCRYIDEITTEDDLTIPKASLGEKEKKVALQLIGAMVEDFKPEQYTDEYQDKLKELIKQKAQGKEVKLAKLKKPRKTKEENLLSSLESSLERLGKEPKRHTKKKSAKK